MKINVTPEQLEILKGFKHEVCDKSNEIDSDHEYDWLALSVGYFIAKGMTPDKAHDLAIIVRYDLQYFHGFTEIVFGA